MIFFYSSVPFSFINFDSVELVNLNKLAKVVFSLENSHSDSIFSVGKIGGGQEMGMTGVGSCGEQGWPRWQKTGIAGGCGRSLVAR